MMNAVFLSCNIPSSQKKEKSSRFGYRVRVPIFGYLRM